MSISRGQVIKYTLLPGIMPRLKHLLGPGRGFLALWIAQVYNALNILPREHPYLNPANRGKFGIRHVIAEASDNIVWDWKHADQIIIFLTVISGLVMLFMQFAVLLLSIISVPALAITNYAGIDVPTSPFDIFVTKAPEQDIAFILLDLVFGIPDIFNSCITTGAECLDTKGNPLPHSSGSYPTPFQKALHEILAMYSYGIFIVGVLVIIYFSITIAGETAAYGTPFGKRMNKFWAPVRLMFFFFLIVPIVYNLNIGQMATLYAARVGSSMATNLWLIFNEALRTGDTTILGENRSWVVNPEVPELGGYLQFMQTVTACKYAERILHDRYIQAYIVRQSGTKDIEINDGLEWGGGQVNVPASQKALYFYKYPEDDKVTGPEPPGPNSIGIADALKFVENGDITIRFGEYNPEIYPTKKGNVYPWCGEYVFINPGVTSEKSNAVLGEDQNYLMSSVFFFYWIILLNESWTSEDLHVWGSNIARNVLNNEKKQLPDVDAIKTLIDSHKDWIEEVINKAIQDQADNADYSIPDALLEKGWAGAAIWYNKIAEINGSFINAVHGIPQPSLWPDAQQQILDARRADDEDTSGDDKFDPVLGDGETVDFRIEEEADIARVERYAYNLWQNESTTIGTNPDYEQRPSSNVFIDSVNAIFGTSGLFPMREDPHVHPLAKLVAVGKSLVDSAVRAFGFSVGITIGGMLGILSNAPGSVADALSGIAVSIATAGLLAGFILYYVLPFMPFIYFFFAVAGWIKAVFEAMVGVPLWALAHIRIDGEGLPGTGAMNGYFLIFEIVVRPAMIVFGLIGCISILSASVYVLNDIFDLVIVNISGHGAPADADPTETEFYRDAASQFFYTVIYTIIVYMFALSCFKLIDLVPDQIMRWLGTSISVFGDAEKDSASKLLTTTSVHGAMIGSQLGQAGGMAKSAMLGHFLGGR
jgi:conjugal transfer/type IV secretion protein DotA/TraY